MSNPTPYIDLHTHFSRKHANTITVRNLFPGENIPSFNGRNFFSVGLHPWELKSKDENNNQKEFRPSVPWIFHGYNANLDISKQLVQKNFLFCYLFSDVLSPVWLSMIW